MYIAYTDDQLRESLRPTHLIHRSHKDNGVQNPDVADFLNCAATPGDYRLNNDVMTGSNGGHGLGSCLGTTREEVERILLVSVQQLIRTIWFRFIWIKAKFNPRNCQFDLTSINGNNYIIMSFGIVLVNNNIMKKT